jgi:hypothetical protein
VKIEDSTPSGGRGLVAADSIEPVAPLLVVPFDNVFRILPEDVDHDEDSSSLYWAASMAWKLLKEKANGGSRWRGWIGALPPKGSLAMPISWTHDEVKLLGDPYIIRELTAQQEAYAEFWRIKQERGGEAVSWSYSNDFMWAVQCILSRSFFDPSYGHMIVPGIDMSNHSFRPSANVAVKHGGRSSQGLDALDEVCDPDIVKNEPSTFCLLSGPRPLTLGSEVTISYGSWTNEVFLLLFGFIPSPNSNDVVILFPCLLDLACCMLHFSSGVRVTDDVEEEVSDALSRSEEVMRKASNYNQLILTGEGCDARIDGAVELARAALGLDASLTPNRFISKAVSERLEALLKVEEVIKTMEGGLRTEAISLSSAYRRSKIEILQAYQRLNWQA